LDDIRDEPGRDEVDRARSQTRQPVDPYLPSRDLTLPRTADREPVQVGDKVYSLRGSESRALATIGAFRVIPADDLEEQRPSRDVWHGDFQRLADQGLIERTKVSIAGKPTAVVVLTRDGKNLLDTHQQPRADGRSQRYHAGLVKPRELPHDAQLYRLYQAEAGRIEAAGGRITRVVLDYELKREYQTFLNRKDRRSDPTPDWKPDRAANTPRRDEAANPARSSPRAGAREPDRYLDRDSGRGSDRDSDRPSDLQTFAAAHNLPIVDGHLELPDLRIEYENPDGRLEYRDLELVTEHYSRSQISGKARAGFTLYRAGRAAGRGTAGGRGTPFDPRHLERL
jgi:hypothetical protein